MVSSIFLINFLSRSRLRSSSAMSDSWLARSLGSANTVASCCKNGWKVWLNGKFLFGRDEYHRGAEIDQYRLGGELKPGSNVILVKLTQNEQKEEWTKEWEFQMRLTDALGTPIASAMK
jgi:hypothetical protein